jgi:hypothetical protein
MFAHNLFIDSFQYGKKTFVNMYITDENLRKSLVAFVDTQTAFTKQAIQTMDDVFTYAAKEIKDKIKDV